MGESMEALIHHFKLVTEGFRVPPGQAYVPIESPRGELGAHVVSDGGTRPFRAHFRDPSFVNLQAMPAMCEGGDGVRRRRRRGQPRSGDGRRGDEPQVPVANRRRRASRDIGAASDGHFASHFDEPSIDFALTETTITDEHPGGAAPDRGALPAAAVGAAADAAPGAERRGAGHPGRHRGVRRDPRHLHRRRQRGGDLLHDVQAAAGRGVPRRRLHHRALRDHGRRRGATPGCRSTWASATTRPPTDGTDHPGAPGVQRGLRLSPR